MSAFVILIVLETMLNALCYEYVEMLVKYVFVSSAKLKKCNIFNSWVYNNV